MKKITLAVLALITVAFFVTGCSGTSLGGENYEYKGFVIDVYENAKGETVIATIYDDIESDFVIKPNTKIIAPANDPVAVGDYIMLTTTRTSDEDIKEMQVSPGYSTEGRLIYVRGEDSPFILTEAAEDSDRLLVKIVDIYGTLIPGISGMGDVIKVYHSSPVLQEEMKAVAEALIFIENGSTSDLTDEDIAFIESQGYKVRSE